MIRLFLGNVGSGKTISAVKEMYDSDSKEHYPVTFSNILSSNIKKNIPLTKDMILKKEGKIYVLNIDHWTHLKKQYGHFNVVIDEAHTILNSRSFSSNINKVLSDFMSLIRKLCNNSRSENTLTLISQLDRRLDVISREMSTEIRYHISYVTKFCDSCNFHVLENNEQIDSTKYKECPYCNNLLSKRDFFIKVHVFKNIFDFEKWKYNGLDTISYTYILFNIEKYFNLYDTNQIEDLITK